MSTSSTSTTLNTPLTWQDHDPIASRVPFYYGWIMLPAAMIAMIATSPGQTFAISVFNNYFRGELGLSHTQLTGAYMLGTLLACLPLSLVGAMMDRYGIRRTMTLIVILFGGTCILTSQVTGLLTLFLAFLFLRMLGQGSLSLTAGNTLAMWFHSRLGTVSGMMQVGVVSVMAFIPAQLPYLISAFGWRWAYAIMGLIVWAVMLPILAIVFRNRPEEIGQLPDGEIAENASEEHSQNSEQISLAAGTSDLNLAMAITTTSYWIMMAMHATWSLVVTAIIFNIVPIFQIHGLSETDAATTLTRFFFCIAIMQLIGGILADRLPLNLLMSLGMAGMAGGIGMLLLPHGRATPWAYLLFGASQGMMSAVGNTVWVRYYGRSHLGKIRGSIMTATVAGSGIGPFLMGFNFDRLGSYQFSLGGFFALLAGLVIATLFATKPKVSTVINADISS